MYGQPSQGSEACQGLGKQAAGWLQARLDLGLTSPQAQWMAKGGSGLSSGNLQQVSEEGPDQVGGSGFLDSPYKHR